MESARWKSTRSKENSKCRGPEVVSRNRVKVVQLECSDKGKGVEPKGKNQRCTQTFFFLKLLDGW